ncbi:uncharacterized protein LOC142884768 isoform X3 [Nelusetta ayraudi]|uniref:uncharacterized protein LOC142884768 isoform X3 n=1 Tax=Nelusetta ayraudi TaxID=303726 RepID=UPI003F725887
MSSPGADSNGVESSLYVSSIKVEYYWSFEYCLKWGAAMAPRRSTRPSEGGSQRRQNPNQKVGIRRTRHTKKRAGSKKSKAQGRVVDTNDDGVRDLLDIIDTNEAQNASTDQEVHADAALIGVCDSDEDRQSVSSLSSGPSVPHDTTNKNPRPSSAMCSVCHKLHQKAKRMKVAIKDKPSDNDPESLTCDQWVLIKTRRPRRIPHFDGNLKRVMRVSDKREIKRKRRKRTRNDSQVPYVAKQQHLSSSRRNEPHDGDHLSPETADNSGLDLFEYQSEAQLDDPEDTHMTIELVSSGVTMEKPTKSVKVQSKQKAAKKTTEFRDLLAQMRGNSSVIIKEKH